MYYPFTKITYILSFCLPQPLFCCFAFKIFFLVWTIFKVFVEFVTVLLLFYVLVFDHEACEILVPRPGIKPAPPTLEGEVLTNGPPGKSLPAASLEQFLRAIWGTVSQTAALILPPIKLNSQLSHCAFKSILNSYNDLVQTYCNFVFPERKQYFIFFVHFFFFLDNWESAGLKTLYAREELHQLLDLLI